MILGIDVLLYMDKTVANITADLTITCFMTKGEDKIDMKGNKTSLMSGQLPGLFAS